jgi:hypothetical protein
MGDEGTWGLSRTSHSARYIHSDEPKRPMTERRWVHTATSPHPLVPHF